MAQHPQNPFPLQPQGQGQGHVQVPPGQPSPNDMIALLTNIQERLEISERNQRDQMTSVLESYRADTIDMLRADRAENRAQIAEVLQQDRVDIMSRVGEVINPVANQVEIVQRDQQRSTVAMQALQAGQLNATNAVPVGGAGGFIGTPQDAASVFNRPFHRTVEMENAAPKEGCVGFGMNASGMIVHLTTKNYDTMIRRWSVYKRLEPFEHYMSGVYRILRAGGVDVDYAGNFELLKDELWNKIDAEVKAPMSAMMPVNYAHLTFKDYVNVLMAQFDPPSMSMELLQVYKKRKQGANEDVRSYLVAKWDLYRRSHTHWATSGFETVREEILEGLINPVVFEKAIEKVTLNFDQLVTSVVAITVSEQTKHRLGRGSGTTDGLAVARGCVEPSKKKSSHEVHQVVEEVDDSHVVNQVTTNNTNINRNRNQTRSRSNQNRNNKGSTATAAPKPNRRRRKAFCFNCNSDDHLCNSPRCPEPGSLRYLPPSMEYMRARYTSGTAVVKNSVGQIAVAADQEIPVENETTFLGLGWGSQPQK